MDEVPGMIGYIVWPALAVGCFALGIKGFSRKGMPFTRKRMITGPPAMVTGVLCLLLGLACSGMAAFLILDDLGADPLGVDRKIRDLREKAENSMILTKICTEIIEVQYATESDPPREIPSLVTWLAENRPAFLDQPFVDKQSRTLRDAWNRPLRLLVDDKGALRLASNGANGTWDNGEQDDMMSLPIVPLELER